MSSIQGVVSLEKEGNHRKDYVVLFTRVIGTGFVRKDFRGKVHDVMYVQIDTTLNFSRNRSTVFEFGCESTYIK